MKTGENYELDLLERQKTFTIEDVSVETDIKCNITFIDKQKDLIHARRWLELTSADVGLDIETRGLDPHQHEVIMLQFGDIHRQFVIDTRKVDVKEIMGLIVNDHTTLIGQNLKFEYKFLKHNWKLPLRKIKDTMLQEIELYNGYMLTNSLKALSKRYLNYEADKTIRMRFLEIGDKPFSKDEIIYGAYDVILPMLINAKQEIKMKERNVLPLMHLENQYLKVLGDMELKGLLVDKSKWMLLYWENLAKYQTAIELLDKFILDNENDLRVSYLINRQQDMFDSKASTTIKWSSPKQVIGLFRSLDICPMEISKSTKRLTYTANAAVLKTSLQTMNKEIAPELKKFIKDYISMKEIEQRVTTFGKDFLTKYVNPVTGRCHSNFKQIVSTGRSSSSSPNLQNIPSDSRYRECFVSESGSKIVNADFSGQENIVLANKSLDKDLLSFYKGGLSDMHSFIASKIFDTPMEDILEATRKKDDKEVLSAEEVQHLVNRGIAKAAGFAINYGGNGHTISKNLGISAEAGDKVYDAYFKSFPGLKTYFEKTINTTLNNGYVHINDVTNRRLNLYWFKRMKSLEGKAAKRREYEKLKGKISRLALNAPVQGTAADITKNAACRFRAWIMSNKLTDKVWITNIIHDEINVECLDDQAELVAVELEKAMCDAGDVWCKTIPLKAKAVISDHWVH